MIIRRDSQSLVCIMQPDHAWLAAIIVAAWRADGFPDHPRREAILLATREHDNGWREEDAETHTDPAGEPLDFIAVPAPVKHRIWPRAVSRLAAEHPYEAALVAQHALTVHADHRANPAWQTFFETMEAQRSALLARANGSAASTIDADYEFVNMGDRLSLVFCNGWRDAFEYRDGRIQLVGSTLRVTPDPFGGERVPLRIRARRLPIRSYASNADLRAALDDASVEFIEGAAVGS